MSIQKQINDAFWSGVGVGLACGHAGLNREEAHSFISPRKESILGMPALAQDELMDDDRVEAIQ